MSDNVIVMHQSFLIKASNQGENPGGYYGIMGDEESGELMECFFQEPSPFCLIFHDYRAADKFVKQQKNSSFSRRTVDIVSANDYIVSAIEKVRMTHPGLYSRIKTDSGMYVWHDRFTQTLYLHPNPHGAMLVPTIEVLGLVGKIYDRLGESVKSEQLV